MVSVKLTCAMGQVFNVKIDITPIIHAIIVFGVWVFRSFFVLSASLLCFVWFQLLSV